MLISRMPRRPRCCFKYVVKRKSDKMPHAARCRHRFCWFYRVKQKPQDCVLTLDTARKMDVFAGLRVAPLPPRPGGGGAPREGKRGSQRMRVLGFDINNALM
eukprot:gene36644-37018_t